MSELSKTGLIQLCVCILFLSGGCEAVAAPELVCAAARGSISRAICLDPKLSRLNREMRGLYRKSLLLDDRPSRIAAQRNWAVERSRNCVHKQGTEVRDCIAQSLNARIVELRTVLDQNAATNERPVVVSLSKVGGGASSNQNPACANASGAVDRAICNDATVRHWEDRLAKMYQQSLDDPSLRTVIAEDQQRWIRERTGSCGALASTKMTDCMLLMIKRRIEQFMQIINLRDDPQDRSLKVQQILTGKTAPPPGLDAETIDRESARAEQSELIIGDARTCIRKNVGTATGAAMSDPKQLEAVIAEVCFADFSKRLSALELGALVKPSFEMLIHQEISASK